MTERYTDWIIREADQALDALEEGLASTAAGIGISSSSDETAPLDIEFGTAALPANEVSDVVSGKILELGEPAIPTVTLYFDGLPAAEGIMMIQDGKIVVKITKKNDGEIGDRCCRNRLDDIQEL